MKLKTKLIPLTGLAAIGATIAPIAMTSCGTSANGTIDLVNWYNPSIDKHKHEIMKLADATELYFGSESNEWVTDTTTILEDMKWSTSMMLNVVNYSEGTDPFEELLPETVQKVKKEAVDPEDTGESPSLIDADLTYNYYNVTLNNIVLGTTYDATKTNQYPTLTYSFNYEFEYEGSGKTSNNSNVDAIWHYSGTFTVTNLPIGLGYIDVFDTGDSIFAILPNAGLILAQQKAGQYITPFSIIDDYSYDGSVTTTDSNQASTTNVQSGAKTIGYTQSTDQVVEYLRYSCPISFGSYYLFSVECSDWSDPEKE